MQVYLEAVGLRGPGMPDWIVGQKVLNGSTAFESMAVVLKVSELLAAGERRRATETVKLAMAVASEAVSRAGCQPDTLPSIFASSDVDGATVTAILQALVTPERDVSPTQFHNSVHNAPSGYWGIATGSHESSTSLAAYDFSFGAGLIEAAVQTLFAD